MYLDNFCCISPAGLLGPESKFQKKEEKTYSPTLFCREPDYTPWINAMQLRRMSKLVRMSVTAGKLCLEGFPPPDAIQVGTAYGMLEETEIFLRKMIEQEETLLTPTAFIQSTHNTMAGQIALAEKSMVHNMTFVHKGHSFESAMLDAELCLSLEENERALVGGGDALTDTSFAFLKRAGVYGAGVTAGEGVAFFNVSGKPGKGSIAEIQCFSMFRSKEKEELSEHIERFMEENKRSVHHEDLLLNGAIAALLSQDNYQYIKKRFFPGNTAVSFKEICGDYPTATSFGLAYATAYLKKHPAKRCWLLNNFGSHWSIWLVKGMEAPD
jgi:hypothetical protein